MSKSNFLNNKFSDKTNIAVGCILAMAAGFLVSRAVLSMAMIAFGLNGIRGVHPREWLKNKWWLLGIVWIGMYAVSWFWSDDKGAWGTRLEVKLPFLLLPLAFGNLPRFSARQLQTITLGIGLLFVASACYSVSYLVRDSEHYIRGYKFSHVLPTLPKFDHIRASMSMVLFMAWTVCVWPQLPSRKARWLAGFILGCLAAFVHLLAAKTGLVSLYLFVFGYGTYLAIRRKIAGILIIVALPLAFMLAMRLMPTLRERVNYIAFTLFMYQKGDRSGNLGDVARIMSYEVAAGIIKQHPLAGVGSGDMKAEMDKVYLARHPDVPEYGRLLPHNQFLTVALGCGLPAMLAFAWWVTMPLGLIRRNRQSFFFLMVWLILLLQLMIEPVLEVQFGVFVFSFFLLLFMHQLPKSKHLPRG